MGKWNKTPNQQQPPSQQFVQNQQRRRQLIIEAAKRRRQKQKKLQQLNQQIKRKQQEALQKHKQQKRNAYNKYLKPAAPSTNMHDKYEQKRKNDKIKNSSSAQVSKWKRKGKSEQKVNSPKKNHIIQPQYGYKNQHHRNISQNQPQIPKISKTTKQVQQQFEKQWGQDQEIIQDLIGSKLLDSLDLDIDTITRGNQYNQQIKYEKQQLIKQQKVQQEIQQMRNLIGYDSLLISNDEQMMKPKMGIDKNIFAKDKTKKNKKQVSEQQTFNDLKHKKQGKLLGWTNLQTVQQADDLFSNCTSHRGNNSKISQKKPSQKFISSRKILQPIPQRKATSNNKSKQNIQKNEKSKSIQKKAPYSGNLTKKNQPPPVSKVTKPAQKKSIKQNSEQKNNKNSQTRIRQTNHHQNNRSLSKQKPRSQQKPRTNPVHQPKKPTPKTQQNFKPVQNPPKPAYSVQSIQQHQPTASVVTHQQFFDVQSFIKNDLLSLNQQEYMLQKQIRDLHLETKDQIKEVQAKNEIRKDYKTSQNLINHHKDADYQSQVYLYSNNIPRTQDQLQNSIQKLDDLLIRKQLESNHQKSNLLEQSSNSIINPLSKPQDFQQQILKLAENISKFEQIPPSNSKGYGNMRRKKMKINNQEISQDLGYGDRHNDQNSEQRSVNMPRPPLLQYSGKSNSINKINIAPQVNEINDDLQDSLQTMGKIQVNEKLRNILFD